MMFLSIPSLAFLETLALVFLETLAVVLISNRLNAVKRSIEVIL